MRRREGEDEREEFACAGEEERKKYAGALGGVKNRKTNWASLVFSFLFYIISFSFLLFHPINIKKLEELNLCFFGKKKKKIELNFNSYLNLLYEF